MQLRTYYGRTIQGTLARVKRDLGPEALILETRSLAPGSAAERMNPGARFEIVAARDPYAPGPPATAAPATQTPAPPPVSAIAKNAPVTPIKVQAPKTTGNDHKIDSPIIRNPQSAIRNSPSPTLLEDLGILRAQIHDLLANDIIDGRPDESEADWREYHTLIAQGIDHKVLAPHFRRWLQWRAARADLRAWLAREHGGPAVRMRGEGLMEWLWLAWSESQGLLDEAPRAEQATPGRPRVIALVGPTGSGKTTTLAKLASISRQQKRQKVAVLTLDTLRFGATEQWRRLARLMDIDVDEIVNPMDLSRSIERWGAFDWIGIDTPGGMTLECEPGRRYGSILAQCPNLETLLVLPATQEEAVSRDTMLRARSLKASRALFSKLDETVRTGGIVNLTMDGAWRIDSFATGTRVPEDWEPATRQALWSRVMAPLPISAPMAGEVAR